MSSVEEINLKEKTYTCSYHIDGSGEVQTVLKDQ